MKQYWNKHITSLILTVIFGLFIGLSFVVDFEPGISIGRDHFWSFVKEMIFFLPLMFILIGMGDVWISKEKAENILKSGSLKSIIHKHTKVDNKQVRLYWW